MTQIVIDERLAVVRYYLSRIDGIDDMAIEAYASLIVGDLDRVPVPEGVVHRPTLATTRKILHEHRWDRRDDKTSLPDTFYSGMVFGHSLLREVGGAGWSSRPHTGSR